MVENMYRFYKIAILILIAGALSACEKISSSTTESTPEKPNPKPEIMTLAIALTDTSIPVGFSSKATAELKRTDGYSLDVTYHPDMVWDSADPSVASINQFGEIKALKEGQTTISYVGKVNGIDYAASSTVVISNAVATSLQLTPSITSVPIGFEEEIKAIASFSDGSIRDVTHESSLTITPEDASIATLSLDNNKLMMTGLAEGKTAIHATLTAQGALVETTAALIVSDLEMVSLAVTPVSDIIMPQGFEQYFKAVATFSDGSVKDISQSHTLVWSSSNEEVATVDNQHPYKSLVKAVSVGKAEIHATVIANGVRLDDSEWVSVNDAALTDIEVTPNVATIPMGFEHAFSAIGVLSDGQRIDITHHHALHWSSNDNDIAFIKESGYAGVVVGNHAGETGITASIEMNGLQLHASANLVVTSAIVESLQLTPADIQLPRGSEVQLTATAHLSDGTTWDVSGDSALRWEATDSEIASISNNRESKGVLTASMPGTTEVKASLSNNGKQVLASVPVTVSDARMTSLSIMPIQDHLPIGLSTRFTATATYSDGSHRDITRMGRLHWSSDNLQVAKIGALGNVIATGSGHANISAMLIIDGQELSATYHFSVISAVVTDIFIDNDTSSVPLGLTMPLIARANLSDGSTLDITKDSMTSWQVDHPEILSVSNSGEQKGTALAKSVGSTRVTVTFFSGIAFHGSVDVHVDEARIIGIDISPSDLNIMPGWFYQYSTDAIYSNGTKLSLDPEELEWTVSDDGISTIDKQGKLSALATGMASVTASYHGMKGNGIVKVTHARLSDVYGYRYPIDEDGLYLVSNSHQLIFRCGFIVDALGTPELGLTGGSGGTSLTINTEEVTKIDVEWGYYKHQDNMIVISKLHFFYGDGISFTCGNSKDVVIQGSATWNVPDNEVLRGFAISANRYTHTIQFASTIKE
ncbi:Ig-like domain-containing protein [Aeromonas sp. R7-5]|uniref:Ig-like domain-containing protein n=1 Tax=Aeromonas sp. R7-5 TaxID=3138477 RepID=UPI0034A3399F